MTATSSQRIRRAMGCAALASLIALGAAVGAAHAAEPYTGNPAQRRACTGDVYRYCAGEIPSISAITACLRRKKAVLSDACRAVFEEQ